MVEGEETTVQFVYCLKKNEHASLRRLKKPLRLKKFLTYVYSYVNFNVFINVMRDPFSTICVIVKFVTPFFPNGGHIILSSKHFPKFTIPFYLQIRYEYKPEDTYG